MTTTLSVQLASRTSAMRHLEALQVYFIRLMGTQGFCFVYVDVNCKCHKRAILSKSIVRRPTYRSKYAGSSSWLDLLCLSFMDFRASPTMLVIDW